MSPTAFQREPSRPTPLAVIGLGCLFPKAEGARAFWANISAGVDAVTEVPPSHWRPEDYFDADPKSPDRTYTARGGFLSPVAFSPLEFGVTPHSLDATDTSQLLGLVAARQALDDAGYGTERDFDRRKVSVILGVTGALELVIPLGARLGHPLWRRALREAGVDERTAEEVVSRIASGYVPWREESFPGLLGNVVAGRIANRLDLGGTNCVVDAACASSLSAMHLAGMELESGRADLVVTGGVDTFNDIFMYMCFSKTPALSPTGDARPFDKDGDGTILGEGLGIVVLKRLADAERDGDRIYAVLRSIGSSSDGKGNAIYAPSSEGQTRALRQAYELAGVSPASVDLVEGHGTGTRVGDAAEIAALAEVFRAAGAAPRSCAIGSVKSQIGHTKAAAGAAGLIKAALALHYKVLPPTIKVREPLEVLAEPDGPLYLNATRRPWLPRPGTPRRAGVSSFGFGGSNFHAVLEEHARERSEVDWSAGVEIVALSADEPRKLERDLAGLSASASWGDFARSASRSRADFDVCQPLRLLFACRRDKDDRAALVEEAQALLARVPPRGIAVSPRGAALGAGPAEGLLAVLFPGQGSQSPAMLLDVACRFPQMLSALETADLVAGDAAGKRLSDWIYPPAAFSEEERARQADALRRTEIAQPALAAVCLGAMRVLRRFGVEGDLFAGHSFGEVLALWAAGSFSDRALVEIAKARGEAMRDAANGAGAMLAVLAPLEAVERLLAQERLDLVIANRNAAAQTVLSGAAREVDRAAEAARARGLRTVRLPVGGAFHSPLVAAAADRFAQSLASAAMESPRRPVFANTTAAPYPADAGEVRALLGGQLARPVEWMRQIEAMHAAGARTFVEVGPGSVLTGLVGSILGGKHHQAFCLDAAGPEEGLFGLAQCLARLAALGRPVDLRAWSPWNGSLREAPAHSVPISGANYRRPTSAATSAPVSSVSSQPPAVVAKSTSLSVPPAGGAPAARSTRPLPASRSQTPPKASMRTSPNEALRVTQESIDALVALQTRTAELHRQFLEGQESAVRTLELLAQTQQRILLGEAAPGAREWSPPGPVAAAPPATPIAPTVAAPSVAAVDDVSRLAGLPDRVRAPEPKTPAPSGDGLAPALLAIVADKTGYPAEMLKLEMELDADLGIDSIKRVEILSAVQEAMPGLPPVRSEQLGGLRTLGDVAALLAASSPAPAPESPAAPPPASTSSPALSAPLAEGVLGIVADKTGYPAEMLKLEMELDADLGIDSIKRVEILSAVQESFPGLPSVRSDQLGGLRTLGDVVGLLGGSSQPASRAPEVRVSQSPPAPPAPVAGVSDLLRFVVEARDLGPPSEANPLPLEGTIWVVGVSDLSGPIAAALERRGFPARAATAPEVLASAPAEAGGLVLVAPKGDADVSDLATAVQVVQILGGSLRKAAERGAALVASVTWMGGEFGLSGNSAGVSGGLAGLVKTVGREWPGAFVKAIDVDPSLERGASMDRVAAEIVSPGPLEVGISASGRRSLALRAEPPPAAGAAPLRRGDVVLVTGGARGVTAECAVRIAAEWQPILVLLGRSPAPTVEEPWLGGLESEAQLHKGLASRECGLSPRELRARVQAIRAAREIRATLARIEAAGARAVYRSVDLRDPDAVARAVREIEDDFGPVRGVVHGAGVLADKRIEDKTREQVDLVLQTKLRGVQALLEAVEGDSLSFLAMFSSSTARFGRIGQVDYAIANEALNKLAQREARRRPGCRVVSVNWGPWAGGMVGEGLAELFRAEGVGLIPTSAGAELLVRELSRPVGDGVEIVVLGPGSVLPEPPPAARALPPAEPLDLKDPPVAFERDVSVETHPFLRSHVLGGKAVLPTAIMIEWLAQGAMHANPGLHFVGVDDLKVLKGVVLDGEASARLAVRSGRANRAGTEFRVAVLLTSGDSAGRLVRHASATIVLSERLPTAPSAELIVPPESAAPSETRFKERLFHGPDFAAIDSLDGLSRESISARVRRAPPPTDWVQRPLRNSWLADPLILDSSFQLAILWTTEFQGEPSLPCGLGAYRQFVRAFPPKVRVVGRIDEGRGARVRATFEFLSMEGALLARIDRYECVLDAGLAAAFRRNRLAEGVHP